MINMPLQLDSITDVTPCAHGSIVVSGSHGGIYPAAVASLAGIRAVLLNDAGIGLDQAGVAGVLALADVGMAAAAVDCQSCQIGSASSMLRYGHISLVNTVAEALGVCTGMPVTKALDLLVNAPIPFTALPRNKITRSEIKLTVNGPNVALLDSASLVQAKDAGKIVITGSHGAIIGGKPERALKVRARIAVFNDAGIGLNKIGISRLPALDTCGIAAVTVSHNSARIGDALSALNTGLISAANNEALRLGAKKHQRLCVWLEML